MFLHGFIPTSRDMHWAGNSKFADGAPASANGCLCYYVALKRLWRHSREAPAASANTECTRSGNRSHKIHVSAFASKMSQHRLQQINHTKGFDPWLDLSAHRSLHPHHLSTLSLSPSPSLLRAHAHEHKARLRDSVMISSCNRIS